MANSRQRAVVQQFSEHFPESGQCQRLGMALEETSGSDQRFSRISAEHVFWPPSVGINMGAPEQFLLIMHWGTRRRFTLHRAGKLTGYFDAQPGDWTLLQPGLADNVMPNDNGPALLIRFTTSDSDDQDAEPALPSVQGDVHDFTSLPKESGLRLNGGHHCLIEDKCLALVRRLHSGNLADAGEISVEVLHEIMERRGAGIAAGQNPLSEQAIDLGYTVSPGGLPASNLRGGLAPFNLRRVMDFVEDNLTASLSVDQLAMQASLSPFHFARSFKQSTGLTPHQYVTERRMRMAKYLLSHAHRRLAEVGRLAGFSSQSRFTTVFRKNVGATPGEYRRLMQAKLIA